MAKEIELVEFEDFLEDVAVFVVVQRASRLIQVFARSPEVPSVVYEAALALSTHGRLSVDENRCILEVYDPASEDQRAYWLTLTLRTLMALPGMTPAHYDEAVLYVLECLEPVGVKPQLFYHTIMYDLDIGEIECALSSQ